MNLTSRCLTALPATALLIGLLHAEPVWGCAVCYGDPDSDLTRGAMAGVLVLGAVVYGVLLGMVGIGVSWFVKARRLRSADENR